MQVRGTFPELNSGMRKGKAAKKAAPKDEDTQKGFTNFVGSRPRPVHAPKTLGARRTVAHLKAGRRG